MDRLTVQYSNNPAVPTKFDLDFVMNLDDANWKELDKLIQRLAAYENTGYEPSEILELKEEYDNLSDSYYAATEQ